MKILAIADEESKALWDYFTPDKLDGVGLIISCGDLSAAYLEFLVTMGSCPVLYVPGNHDQAYVSRPPEGCVNIDGRVYNFNGIRILGLGGSLEYKAGHYMYTEGMMRLRLMKTYPWVLMNGGVDIVVTHAPPRGWGDLEDLPHRGFECFNRMLYLYRPVYMLHGHVHASYMSGFKRERCHPSGAVIINAYDRYIFDFKENDKNQSCKCRKK